MIVHDGDESGDGEYGGGQGEAGKSGILAESLRKALVTGISAVFMTEEGIRSALGDLRLPKEAIAFLIQQTGNTRRELTRMVGDELKTFLRNADLSGVLKKALAGMKLEVKAEIRFVDEAGRPTVTAAEVTTTHEPERAHKRKRKS